MPASKQKRTLFVAIPNTPGREALIDLVRHAAISADLVAVPDPEEGKQVGSMDAHQLQAAIQRSSVVLVDVSEEDSNTMYQLGLAQSLGKPVILVARDSRGIPFQLAALRVLVYGNYSQSAFHSRLQTLLLQAKDHPDVFRAGQPITKATKRHRVFISYSHCDQEFLDRLLVHLKPLERQGLLEIWADTKLRAGDSWKSEIQAAMDRATVAILIVSADFLASEFIVENELPPLLLSAQENGTRIIPVVAKHCRFSRDPDLQTFQAINDPRRPLALMSTAEQENVYDQIAAEIERWSKKA